MLASGIWLVAFLAAAGAPAANDTTPLHEIGERGAPAGVCGALVVHANAAIAAELRNRQWLVRTIARLRSIDVEGNAVAAHGALGDLSGLSAQIHDDAVRTDDELHRLGDAADRLPAAHRAELRTFSDALYASSAEHRRIGTDLAALTVYLTNVEVRGENMTENDLAHQAAADPLHHLAGNDPPSGPLSSPYQSAGSPNRMARAAASDFASRLGAVSADETRAALHGDEAVSGCS